MASCDGADEKQVHWKRELVPRVGERDGLASVFKHEHQLAKDPRQVCPVDFVFQSNLKFAVILQACQAVGCGLRFQQRIRELQFTALRLDLRNVPLIEAVYPLQFAAFTVDLHLHIQQALSHAQSREQLFAVQRFRQEVVRPSISGISQSVTTREKLSVHILCHASLPFSTSVTSCPSCSIRRRKKHAETRSSSTIKVFNIALVSVEYSNWYYPWPPIEQGARFGSTFILAAACPVLS